MSIGFVLAFLALILTLIAAGEFYRFKTGYLLVLAVLLLSIAFILDSGFVHA